jgi:DNA repair exonuclease SbcCD nuclease subunit
MNRAILYSDLQLHPWKEFSTLHDGINDRLLDHINVLNQIYAYAVKNEIKTIIFGGDMFEARAKIDVIAAKLLADWKYKVSKAGIEQIDLIGNHDLYDKSSLHNSIDLYSHFNGQTVIVKPGWYIFPKTDVGILFVPYMHRLDDIKAALKAKPLPPTNPARSIAIIHYGLYDVPMETHAVIRDQGYDTEGQIRLSDLDELLPLVRFAFFGHFHITTAVTDKVHFIGTPLQHKWGEKSVQTRFLDIDFLAGTFKSVYTQAPRFHEWEDISQVDTLLVKNNFCKVWIDDLELREKTKQLLFDQGARGADVLLRKKKQESTNRLNLDLGMSFEEMGTRMLQSDSDTKLDKSRLKQVLFEVFQEAALNRNRV